MTPDTLKGYDSATKKVPYTKITTTPTSKATDRSSRTCRSHQHMTNPDPAPKTAPPRAKRKKSLIMQGTVVQPMLVTMERKTLKKTTAEPSLSNDSPSIRVESFFGAPSAASAAT